VAIGEKSGGGSGGSSGNLLQPVPSNADLLAAVNKARAENGAPAVKWSDCLANAAKSNSYKLDREATSNGAGHSKTWWNYDCSGSGVEEIFSETISYGNSSSGDYYVQSLMGSAPHSVHVIAPGYTYVGAYCHTGITLSNGNKVTPECNFLWGGEASTWGDW